MSCFRVVFRTYYCIAIWISVNIAILNWFELFFISSESEDGEDVDENNGDNDNGTDGDANPGTVAPARRYRGRQQHAVASTSTAANGVSPRRHGVGKGKDGAYKRKCLLRSKNGNNGVNGGKVAKRSAKSPKGSPKKKLLPGIATIAKNNSKMLCRMEGTLDCMMTMVVQMNQAIRAGEGICYNYFVNWCTWHKYWYMILWHWIIVPDVS